MSRCFEVRSRGLLLEDVFKVEAAYIEFELTGGALSEAVRRLNCDRENSAAKLLINRDRDTVMLVEPFRYPASIGGSPWLTELPAGVVDSLDRALADGEIADAKTQLAFPWQESRIARDQFDLEDLEL